MKFRSDTTGFITGVRYYKLANNTGTHIGSLWSAGGTNLGAALDKIYKLAHDRLIVVTDEQSHDRVAESVAARSYMINVGSYRNGVGYGRWTHIDGFSESVIRFIAEVESEH